MAASSFATKWMQISFFSSFSIFTSYLFAPTRIGMPMALMILTRIFTSPPASLGAMATFLRSFLAGFKGLPTSVAQANPNDLKIQIWMETSFRTNLAEYIYPNVGIESSLTTSDHRRVTLDIWSRRRISSLTSIDKLKTIIKNLQAINGQLTEEM